MIALNGHRNLRLGCDRGFRVLEELLQLHAVQDVAGRRQATRPAPVKSIADDGEEDSEAFTKDDSYDACYGQEDGCVEIARLPPFHAANFVLDAQVVLV